jgi:hypothetical protein
MYDVGKKIDELTGVLVMAKVADAKGQRETLLRMLEELHMQTVIMLREIRRPMQTSATIYDLAKERGARAQAHA